jgi:hypothetical protein
MKIVCAAAVLVVLGCGQAPIPAPEAPAGPAPTVEIVSIPPPVGTGAMAPRWAVGTTEPTLSWVEPRGEAGWVLRVSSLRGEEWSEVRDVVISAKFFANWADLPVVVEGANGRLALWPEKLGEGTYDYGIHVAAEQSDGTWQRRGFVHDDLTPAEYGFASPVALADGTTRAFWLDGRAMPAGGAMHIGSASLGAKGGGPTEVLDDRVCECCTTDAALTSSGPIVVYRDRSADETRDIGVVRWTDGGWSAPRTLADDGWVIQGCPVNGPAIDARDQRVVVVWFTAAQNRPRVQVSWSDDAGAGFSPAQLLAEGQAVLGRVDVTLVAEAGALLSWVETAGRQAVVRGRWLDDDGRLGETFDLAATMASRNGGFPRLRAVDDGVLLAHLDPSGGLQVLRAAGVSRLQPRPGHGRGG